MLSDDELARIREEQEETERWRRYSCHVVAEMLEACAICGAVREKEHLNRCQWCDDTYFCKDGLCAPQHRADVHADVAYWTW
ncbi:MAG TPA: hypothetical protein VGW33_15030 [Terriglobia bacterium]|nr:hypothetical protein [Terriglobia bacterium]